jgi:hypothetical protein
MLKKQNKKQKTRDTKSYLDTQLEEENTMILNVYIVNSVNGAVYAGKGGLYNPFKKIVLNVYKKFSFVSLRGMLIRSLVWCLPIVKLCLLASLFRYSPKVNAVKRSQFK